MVCHRYLPLLKLHGCITNSHGSKSMKILPSKKPQYTPEKALSGLKKLTALFQYAKWEIVHLLEKPWHFIGQFLTLGHSQDVTHKNHNIPTAVMSWVFDALASPACDAHGTYTYVSRHSHKKLHRASNRLTIFLKLITKTQSDFTLWFSDKENGSNAFTYPFDLNLTLQ